MATKGVKPGYIWDDYRPEDFIMARSARHRRHVDESRRIIAEWLGGCSHPYTAVSGGKDSVCVCHLVAEVSRSIGCSVPPVMWHDSGVEWPGVELVLSRLQDAGCIDEMIIVRPETDVLQLKRLQLAGRISARKKDRLALFDPIRRMVGCRGLDGVALGLRSGESRGRAMNRATKGAVYPAADGLLHCTPIVDWSWQDVFAYIAHHRLPLHPIYSAPLLGLEHRGRIRLSWWASTDYHWHGEVHWVRLIYPEIYQRLVDALPGVSLYA